MAGGRAQRVLGSFAGAPRVRCSTLAQGPRGTDQGQPQEAGRSCAQGRARLSRELTMQRGPSGPLGLSLTLVPSLRSRGLPPGIPLARPGSQRGHCQVHCN